MGWMKKIGSSVGKMFSPETIGSAIIGTGQSLLSMNSADKAVKRQLDWERDRALNAHQWEVQDLKNAGLNPILSAGGSGAMTGGISAPVPDVSGINTGIQNAISAYQAKTDNALKGAEIKNINEDTKNKQKENDLLETQIILNGYKVGLIDKETTEKELTNQLLRYKAENKEVDFWLQQVERTAKALGLVLGGVGLSAGALKRAAKAKNKLSKSNYDYDDLGQYFNMPSL